MEDLDFSEIISSMLDWISAMFLFYLTVLQGFLTLLDPLEAFLAQNEDSGVWGSLGTSTSSE